MVEEDTLEKKIIKLNGGLGNQMFQYAFAYALAKKFNVEILFDFTFFDEVQNYKNVTSREFELGSFNIDCPRAEKEDLENVIHSAHRSKPKRLLWNLFKIPRYKANGNTFSQKTAFNFEKDLFKNPEYIYYEGYFQNEKYFKHLKKELIEKFKIVEPLDEKNQDILNKILETESVSIHIRRGDYITLDYVNKFHGTCSLDYYKKAAGYIEKHVKSPYFFIFSDDTGWVIENLKLNSSFTIIDFNKNKGWFDLNLMKQCKHNIIANSSFSWWGAWLNENPEKIVVAPKNWTAQKQKCGITPNEWIKM